MAAADDKVIVQEYRLSHIAVVYKRLFEEHQVDIAELVDCTIKTIQDYASTKEYVDATEAIQLLNDHPEYIFAYVYVADKRLKIRQILCDICKRSLVCPLSPITHCECRSEFPISEQFDACIDCITVRANLNKHVGEEHNLVLGTLDSIWDEYYAEFMVDIARKPIVATDGNFDVVSGDKVDDTVDKAENEPSEKPTVGPL